MKALISLWDVMLSFCRDTSKRQHFFFVQSYISISNYVRVRETPKSLE